MNPAISVWTNRIHQINAELRIIAANLSADGIDSHDDHMLHLRLASTHLTEAWGDGVGNPTPDPYHNDTPNHIRARTVMMQAQNHPSVDALALTLARFRAVDAQRGASAANNTVNRHLVMDVETAVRNVMERYCGGTITEPAVEPADLADVGT